jgi:ethanolamine ammonia-lyase large subunit
MGNCSQINNTTIQGTSTITYDGPPLPCTDVNTCDNLNTILAKFDAVICDAIIGVNEITINVTDINNSITNINNNITDIYNQLAICCNICDFTGTANELNCLFTGVANQL